MCADMVKASPRLLILPLNSWSRKSLLCIALKAWYESHTYQPTPTKNTIVRPQAPARTLIGKPFCIRLSFAHRHGLKTLTGASTFPSAQSWVLYSMQASDLPWASHRLAPTRSQDIG